MNRKSSNFNKFAQSAAHVTGLPSSFFTALLIIGIWGLTGPFFHFNDTWQLVINTSTTIITFLMVFLIQNAQNRDSAAIQLKLDELIRAMDSAHNSLIDLEEMEESEIIKIREQFAKIASEARKELRERKDAVEEIFDSNK